MSGEFLFHLFIYERFADVTFIHKGCKYFLTLPTPQRKYADFFKSQNQDDISIKYDQQPCKLRRQHVHYYYLVHIILTISRFYILSISLHSGRFNSRENVHSSICTRADNNESEILLLLKEIEKQMEKDGLRVTMLLTY